MFSLFQYKKQGKTPVIRQHEFTECGLACLAMVLGHYDHHVSVSQLRREISVSADAGTSMAELLTLASDKNMSGRVLKGEITEIETSELPLIAFWRGGHREDRQPQRDRSRPGQRRASLPPERGRKTVFRLCA